MRQNVVESLDAAVHARNLADLDVDAHWSLLAGLVDTSTYKKSSLKYVDPPYIKQLCTQRRLCSCPVTKQDLMLQIIAARQQERKSWITALEQRARVLVIMMLSATSAEGTLYVPAACNEFVRKCGSVERAADELEQHTRNTFTKGIPTEDSAGIYAHIKDMLGRSNHYPPVPFTPDELRDRLQALKSGKTGGPLASPLTC